MGDLKGTPDDAGQVEQGFEQDAGRQTADKNGSMSAQDKQKLSQSMAALAKEAQEMGLQMQNMDETARRKTRPICS